MNQTHVSNESGLLFHCFERCEDVELIGAICLPINITDDSGVFHALEHMFFCGSNEFPWRDNYLQLKASGLLNKLNAYTTNTHIGFEFSTFSLAHYLFAFDFLFDSITSPLFTQDAFDNEIHSTKDGIKYSGVLINEMFAAVNNEFTQQYIELKKSILGNHADSYFSGGIPKSIIKLSVDDVRTAYMSVHSGRPPIVFTNKSGLISKIEQLYVSRAKSSSIARMSSNTTDNIPTQRYTTEQKKGDFFLALQFAGKSYAESYFWLFLIDYCLARERITHLDQNHVFNTIFCDFTNPVFVLACKDTSELEIKEQLKHVLKSSSQKDIKNGIEEFVNRFDQSQIDTGFILRDYWPEKLRSLLSNSQCLFEFSKELQFDSIVVSFEAEARVLIDNSLLIEDLSYRTSIDILGSLKLGKADISTYRGKLANRLPPLNSKYLPVKLPILKFRKHSNSLYSYDTKRNITSIHRFGSIQNLTELWLKLYPGYEYLIQNSPTLEYRRSVSLRCKTHLTDRSSGVILLSGSSTCDGKKSNIGDIEFNIDPKILERLGAFCKVKHEMLDRVGHQLVIFDSVRNYSYGAKAKSLMQGLQNIKYWQTQNIDELITDLMVQNYLVSEKVTFVENSSLNGGGLPSEMEISPFSAVQHACLKCESNSKNQLWLVNSGAGYAASSYQIPLAGDNSAASYAVLGQIISNYFIIPFIRNNGLAYSGGITVDSSNGAFSVFTYRDSNPLENILRIETMLLSLRASDITQSMIDAAKFKLFNNLWNGYSGSNKYLTEIVNSILGRSQPFRSEFRKRILSVDYEQISCSLNFIQNSEPNKSVLSQGNTLPSAFDSWEVNTL